MTAPANARAPGTREIASEAVPYRGRGTRSLLVEASGENLPGSAATETSQIVCKEVVRDEEVTRRSFKRFFFVAGAREGAPIVEVPGVIAQPFPANSFNQLRSQPFALVFVGSGEVTRFGGMSPAGAIPFY